MIWAIVYFMGNLVLEQVKINQNTFSSSMPKRLHKARYRLVKFFKKQQGQNIIIKYFKDRS